MQALEGGEFGRAASFFEFAIKKAPADPALRLLVADAYIRAGRHARAEVHVQVLIDQSDALYQRGEYELLARARAAKAQIEAAAREPDPGAEPPGDAPPGGAPSGEEILGPAPLGGAPSGDTVPAPGQGAAPQPESAAAPPAPEVPAAGAEADADWSYGFDVDLAALEPPEPVAAGRSRIVACPWCERTVLLDAHYSGRCECPWFQPARGTRLYLADLQRLCADRRATLMMRVYQDDFALDGRDVRLRLMSTRALKVDPRLTFELDLGHPLVRPDQLAPVQPDMHPTAVFRLIESPGAGGSEPDGQFYSFAELLDRIEVEYPDSYAQLSRDIHYQRQLAWHLPPDHRQRADEQLAAGARSYGRCLLSAGMTMEDLLRMVPGWQVLRPIGGGHGRLEGVRSLVRKGFVTEAEAADAITKSRGKDSLEALVDARVIDRTTAEEVAAEVGRRKVPVPLRDDIMERLCRRGVISRVTLVKAGLVVGLVDAEVGQEADSLAGAMGRIPAEELEREREVLARKDTARRSERLALGKILVELGFCSRQRVAAALARQLKEDSMLGELLVRELAITPEQLTVALCEQEYRLEALISGPPEPAVAAPAAPVQPKVVEKPAEKAQTRKADPAEGKATAKDAPAVATWRVALYGVVALLGVVAAGFYGWWVSRSATPRDLQVDMSEFLAAGRAKPESLLRGVWRDASGSVLATADVAILAKEVTAALPTDPRNAALLTNGAFLRLDEGNIRDSLVLARRALEVAPRDPFAHVAMGAIWLASANEFEAGREFQEARKLLPGLAIEAAFKRQAGAAEGSRLARRRVSLNVTLSAPGTASTPATPTLPVSPAS